MSANSSSGIGFWGLLTIVFIVLKLTGYITWSWFWVLSPLLFGFVFMFGVMFFMLLCVSLGGAKLTVKKRKPDGN